jgi:hypothetical protein
LRDHTIEPDVALAEIRNAMLPDAQAESFAAKLRLDDVQPDKAEMRVVCDGGNRADRFAAPYADEESIGIGRAKAAGVVHAGIPAFDRGPFDRAIHFTGCHRAHDEVVRRVCRIVHGVPLDVVQVHVHWHLSCCQYRIDDTCDAQPSLNVKLLRLNRMRYIMRV